MRHAVIVRVVIFFLLVLAALGIAGFYLAFKSSLPETIEKPKEAQQIDQQIQEIHAAKKPGFGIYIKDRRTIVIRWNFLPVNTKTITIFRAAKGKEQWIAWKTITLSREQLENGSVEVRVGANENPNSFSYYAEGHTATGEFSWVSTSTFAQTYVPPLIIPTTPAANVPPPIVSQPTQPTSTIIGPPIIPPPSSTVSLPPGEVYYTPSGQVSGVAPEQTASFWVLHVNKNIQINYQGLPNNVDNIVVDRSSSQNGPWTKLLAQENVNPSKLNSIGIIDLAITDPHYYRLNAFHGSTLVKTYGPTYLEGLSQ